MRRILAILITATLLATGRAPADEPASYDLATCISSALASDPDLTAAAADLAAANAQLEEANAGRLGQAEYTQYLGFVNRAKGDILDPPKENKDAIFNGLGPFTRLEIMFSVPLYTFGKLSSALEAARQGIEAQRAGGEAKRAEVILTVKRLYYGLLLTQQLSGTLHEMLDNLDTALRQVQERLDKNSKTVTEIDLLKLKTGRSKFAKGVYEIDAAQTLTSSALARAIGRESLDGFTIAETKLTATTFELGPLEQYLNDGKVQRPETRQIHTGIAAQTAKVELEEAEYYPSIFLSTGFQYAEAGNRTRQRNPFASDDFNYTRPVGIVGVRWDLNFFHTGAKVDQARAELAKLQAQQRSATSGLQLEIRKAYAQVVQARDTMKATEEGRRAGRSLIVLTVSNFDLGIGEAEELFKGLGLYTEASADYLRSVHDYNVSIGELSRAVGHELTGLKY